MRAVVGLPVPLQGEGPVTVGAAVRLAAVVDLLVDHQTNQSRVGLPAVPALIGLLSLVGVQVSLQVGLLVKAPLTLWAEDHLLA